MIQLIVIAMMTVLVLVLWIREMRRRDRLLDDVNDPKSIREYLRHRPYRIDP